MNIDINCDLGERVGNDATLMPLISSCNIACGGHAGDAQTMYDTLVLAKKYRVKIGAHPSFPDRENFGRKVIEMGDIKLTESIYNQIIDLKKEADKLNLTIHHIKPHGALYNDAVKNIKTANIVLEAIKKTKLKVFLYAPYKSVLAKQAMQKNIPVIYEAFMDRCYNNDLTLVSRQEENAVISESKLVYKQLYDIVFNKNLGAVTGEKVAIKAATFCIHGDNKKAVTILKYIHQQFKSLNINIS